MARRVQRPALFAALVTAAALGGAAAVLAPLHLQQRIALGPQVVAVDAAELEQALEDSPWFAFEPGEEPAVWLLSAPACAPCRRDEAAVLKMVQGVGGELRVLVAAPRGASDAEASLAAEFARRRDGAAFAAWRLEPDAPLRIPVGVSDVDVGSAAVEGYAEWGRASFDRIAAVVARNDTALEAPTVFWRRGQEWRMAVSPAADDLEALRQDLEAQAAG